MTVFNIKKDKVEQEEQIVHVYTFNGKHDLYDDDGYPILDIDNVDDAFNEPFAYAITIKKGNKINYYVKRGKYGSLYDPIGLYSEGSEHRQMRHAGRPEWVLTPTNKKVFDYYVQFLKTKNPAWLRNAEREV